MYRLRCELFGHEEDVRVVSVTQSHGVITGSRDRTIKLWAEGDKEFVETSTLVGHDQYVVSLAPYEQTDKEFLLASGSMDTTIKLWNPHVSPSPIRTFTGHKYSVTAVIVLPVASTSFVVISASLDGSIRAWNPESNGQCERTVENAHMGPIQCMVRISDRGGEFLTGAGDGKIMRWSSAKGAGGITIKQVQTYEGHSDTVRALAEYPGVGFVSGSHDLTARLWTLDGSTITEFVGHKMLLYAVAVSKQGVIATGSEDNSVKLWRQNGDCIQTIEHPGCVWTLKFLSSSEDLVTGCADAVARVWTTEDARVADAETIHNFEQQLQNKKRQDDQGTTGSQSGNGLPEGLKVEDAAALQVSGNKDGDTKFVRENGDVVAYNWSASGFEWQRIGTVVSGPENNVNVPRKWHKGREWDFVFDVDVEDGAPMLKLAVNRGDDVYDAADRFMQENELPLSYREQIVQFIIKNTNGEVGATNTGGAFYDPFTGGNAYVPGQGTQQPQSSQPQQQQQALTGGGVDPFTGGSNPEPPTLQHIPKSNYDIYRAMPNAESVMRKITELNAQQPQERQLDESQLKILEGLWKSAISGQGEIGQKEADVLTSVIMQWSDESLFPAFDLCRVLCLSSIGESMLLQGNRIEQYLEPLQRGSCNDDKCAQTATKFLTNLFNTDNLREWVINRSANIIEILSQTKFSNNDKVLKGVASFLLNVCVASKKETNSVDVESKLQCLSLLFEGMTTAVQTKQMDAIFTFLVGIGTLIIGDSDLQKMAKDMDILSNINLVKQLDDPKVLRAANDIQLVILQCV
eukprot:TRINITY_DN2813_c1_g1_i1.p1 TRINITY_DN2813_c1_g1~~TRINITY_DN2813_c1_g1_i1.p1  ORF type:complete len:801 (-),score=103.55 TRINITY_DN2813_c1_g1_i1:283-2685(-)